MKEKVVLLILLAVAALGVMAMVYETARGPLIIHEVEIQVGERDIQCIYGYFESQRQGVGLSCDWQTTPQVVLPTPTLVPIPTPTPNPYP